MKTREKVVIMRCNAYDADKIAGIISEGMAELGVRPSGKVLLKPNVVMAHPEIFPHAFTRHEFLDGVISATKSRAEDVAEIAVGERSGITIPTRWNFKNAGYPGVIKKHKVKTYYFDEVQQRTISINGKDNLRRHLIVPKPVADADFLINLPKFKAHPWCRLTLSLKNFIGLQDDRHRLVDHNIFLEHKIADLQEVIQPRFIAVDGIIAGQKMMLTPTPFDLGAIVMGTNSCAVDTVGCHMVHVDPNDLIHLKMASERGFGPMALEDIEVVGDFPLAEIQEKTEAFEFCLVPVDQYFKAERNLSCTVGKFPEAHSRDYCWGGCPGALQEAVHIMKGFDPEVLDKIRKIHYVVGRVDGPLDLDGDEKVLFVGDCAQWKGTIGNRTVNIKSRYKTVRDGDEQKTKSNDMLLKIFQALWNCIKHYRYGYVRARGCTASVGDHVNYLSILGRVSNPNFDPMLVFSVTAAYWTMRFKRFINRFSR